MARDVYGGGQLGPKQAVQGGFVLRLKHFHLELSATQEPDHCGVNQRHAESRSDQWHRNSEVLIDPFELSQVSQLVWSCYVADGGKKPILDNRAEQDVGTET